MVVHGYMLGPAPTGLKAYNRDNITGYVQLQNRIILQLLLGRGQDPRYFLVVKGAGVSRSSRRRGSNVIETGNTLCPSFENVLGHRVGLSKLVTKHCTWYCCLYVYTQPLNMNGSKKMAYVFQALRLIRNTGLPLSIRARGSHAGRLWCFEVYGPLQLYRIWGI